MSTTDQGAGSQQTGRLAHPAAALPSPNFDFLRGSYRQAARTRLAALSLVGAIMAAVLLVAGNGIATMRQVSSVNGQASLLAQRTQALQVQIDQQTTINGRSEGELRTDLANKTALVAAATAGEAPIAAILGPNPTSTCKSLPLGPCQLWQAVTSVPGATLVSVSFSPSGQAGTPGAPPPSATPTTAAPTSPTPGPPSASTAVPTTLPAQYVSVSIALQLSSYTDVNIWESTLAAQVPELTGAQTIVAGSTTSISVTTTGELTGTVLSTHSAEIDSCLLTYPPAAGANCSGLALPTTTTTPTTTPTTVPGSTPTTGGTGTAPGTKPGARTTTQGSSPANVGAAGAPTTSVLPRSVTTLPLAGQGTRTSNGRLPAGPTATKSSTAKKG